MSACFWSGVYRFFLFRLRLHVGWLWRKGPRAQREEER